MADVEPMSFHVLHRSLTASHAFEMHLLNGARFAKQIEKQSVSVEHSSAKFRLRPDCIVSMQKPWA